MKETWLIFLIMLAGGILFTVGFIFGISSMYYVIPLIIVLGIVYWYLEKTPEGKRNWSIATWWKRHYTTTNRNGNITLLRKADVHLKMYVGTISNRNEITSLRFSLFPDHSQRYSPHVEVLSDYGLPSRSRIQHCVKHRPHGHCLYLP